MTLQGVYANKIMRGILHCLLATIVGWLLHPADSGQFAHERRAAYATDSWGGMRVDWTVVADWPVGDSIIAREARVWIGDRLRNGGKLFNGDYTDWDAMVRFYGNRFLADNGLKKIEKEWRTSGGERDEPRTEEPNVKPGADAFLEDRAQWFCRRTAMIAYEDERIVSYRSGFYGSFVGNATSAAYVKCATFRKSDATRRGQSPRDPCKTGL